MMIRNLKVCEEGVVKHLVPGPKEVSAPDQQLGGDDRKLWKVQRRGLSSCDVNMETLMTSD